MKRTRTLTRKEVIKAHAVLQSIKGLSATAWPKIKMKVKRIDPQ